LTRRHRKNFRPKNEPKFQINGQIRAGKVRLVGDNLADVAEAIGKPVEPGVYPTRQAQDMANALDLDLVEISPNADPPVCKIINYKKFLYQRKKKEKEIKSNTVKTEIKEIRFGPNTDDHDFNFKCKHAEKFLLGGKKVRATVQFRGRSIVFKERGELLLLKFIQELDEFGYAEALPKMEGRKMFVFIAPNKNAKVKKKGTSPKKEKSKAKKAQPKDADKSEEASKKEVTTEAPAKEAPVKEVEAQVKEAPTAEAPKNKGDEPTA